MVSQLNPDRAAIADALRRWTERSVYRIEKGGRVQLVAPSQRDIARRTGIPRSTLGDFLRNPEGVSQRTVDRMAQLLDDPRLQVVDSGPNRRVAYVDAPRWTRESLGNLRIPDGASAFRVVTRTDESRYNGFRSTEWIGDLDRLAELAEFAPGGYGNIERIVFDVGD